MNPDSSYLGEICEIYYVDYNNFTQIFVWTAFFNSFEVATTTSFFLRPLMPVTLFL